MKYSFFYAGFIIFAACNNQHGKAKETATQIQTAVEQTRPGTIPTKEGSWMMKAKINGKSWSASSMMPPVAAGRIIGYYNNEYIGLPFSKTDLVTGRKIIFSDNDVADLSASDHAGIWGGRKGTMEIIKADDHWVERKFYFTATNSSADQSIEVSDGYFRIGLTSN